MNSSSFDIKNNFKIMCNFYNEMSYKEGICGKKCNMSEKTKNSWYKWENIKQ